MSRPQKKMVALDVMAMAMLFLVGSIAEYRMLWQEYAIAAVLMTYLTYLIWDWL